ncbi:MAG: PEP-CTERM sorting domain-containing protein [Terracidiphilus sp.]
MSIFIRKINIMILLATLVVFVPIAHATGISASATYTYSQVSPGVYDYSLILDNTGTTNIETFWFAWYPQPQGLLIDPPMSVSSPSGWVGTTPGDMTVQWTTSSNPLAPEIQLSGFSFESTETPTQMQSDFPGPNEGPPVSLFTVYAGAPYSGSPYVAQAIFEGQTPTATPEPATWILMLSGLSLAAITFRSRLLPGV